MSRVVDPVSRPSISHSSSSQIRISRSETITSQDENSGQRFRESCFDSSSKVSNVCFTIQSKSHKYQQNNNVCREIGLVQQCFPSQNVQ